jgi:hypothetical protein
MTAANCAYCCRRCSTDSPPLYSKPEAVDERLMRLRTTRSNVGFDDSHCFVKPDKSPAFIFDGSRLGPTTPVRRPDRTCHRLTSFICSLPRRCEAPSGSQYYRCEPIDGQGQTEDRTFSTSVHSASQQVRLNRRRQALCQRGTQPPMPPGVSRGPRQFRCRRPRALRDERP